MKFNSWFYNYAFIVAFLYFSVKYHFHDRLLLFICWHKSLSVSSSPANINRIPSISAQLHSWLVSHPLGFICFQFWSQHAISWFKSLHTDKCLSSTLTCLLFLPCGGANIPEENSEKEMCIDRPDFPQILRQLILKALCRLHGCSEASSSGVHRESCSNDLPGPFLLFHTIHICRFPPL